MKLYPSIRGFSSSLFLRNLPAWMTPRLYVLQKLVTLLNQVTCEKTVEETPQYFALVSLGSWNIQLDLKGKKNSALDFLRLY